MKKMILIAVAVIAAQAAMPALAAERSLNVLLAGGSEDNAIEIKLSPDGRSYVIDSVVPLEVGGDICVNPPGMPTELVCQATAIGGFEVNAGGGNDKVTVAREVPISVSLRGGSGSDELIGGAGADALLGGPGDDRLVGRGGADSLIGGDGNDRLVGCSGNDLLRGGPGNDVLLGGSGANDIVQ
jgi:Ca2+-binding RTX toxin-like protein